MDPADGVYMGLHPTPPDTPANADHPDPYPPDFPVPPAVAGGDHLPDDNYFLPLADPDEDEGEEGNADGNVDIPVPGDQTPLPAIDEAGVPEQPAVQNLAAPADPDGGPVPAPHHGYNLRPRRA